MKMIDGKEPPEIGGDPSLSYNFQITETNLFSEIQ